MSDVADLMDAEAELAAQLAEVEAALAIEGLTLADSSEAAGLSATLLLPTAEAAPPQAATVPAWLIEYARKRHVALGMHAALEIVEQPAIVPVAGAPYYGVGMMRWQERWIPVLDLGALLNAYPKPGAPKLKHALVIAYQAAPRQPLQYAALATLSLAQTVQVADSQQCELPTDSDLWPWISASCFKHDGAAVPIVDTSRMFAMLG